jgi:hypothetical protein
LINESRCRLHNFSASCRWTIEVEIEIESDGS